MRWRMINFFYHLLAPYAEYLYYDDPLKGCRIENFGASPSKPNDDVKWHI